MKGHDDRSYNKKKLPIFILIVTIPYSSIVISLLTLNNNATVSIVSAVHT